ncbi:hypothetical protein [Thioclava sp. L04-15]|uniref:hypothetical protein n=1 Tax=Thioclava sp. L04-15 TaxID=1915318 RepID=UPI00143C28B3|nr:hypothetical protein [Thioclava sp. L04-15]
MTRKSTALIAIAGLLALIAADLLAAPHNPYHAPPAFALGSGQVASGGFCGALPD